MKRSEVLDEITFILDKEVGDLDFPSISEVILNKLEEVGMLPPPDEIEAVTRNLIYSYYTERVEPSDEINKNYDRPNIHKLWEPEDKWTVEYECSKHPYGKSVVEEVNAEIKALNERIDRIALDGYY